MPHEERVSSQVRHLLQSLTLEEKVALLAGKNMWETVNIDRLHIPSLKMTDGPAGARGSKWTYGSLTTWIPCGISLAATFDPAMVEQVGRVLGQEARRKGCQVLLAPTMNLSRSPLGGRNFESYGEDPYLVGVIATAMIRGIQAHGVGACMKHFILNDTETRRFNVDQTIDERTLREVYMKPFTMVLNDPASTPWTAMVSYPKINGLHADISPHILPRLLRQELQFDRLVMSDWGGLNSTADSLRATTDLEMPGPAVRRGERLLAAIRAGEVEVAALVDPSVRRFLQLLERTGLLGNATESAEHSEEATDDPIFHRIARDAAQSGLVLLKNDKGILPLKPTTLQRVAIIGPNACQPTAGGAGSAAVNPFYVSTPEACLRDALHAANSELQVSYEPGIPSNLRPPLLGKLLTVPDGSRKGWQVSFFEGHALEGPVVASSIDGDVPAVLDDRPYSYRATGVVTPQESGRYTWSLANTGKAKLFLNDELLIDNTEWTGLTGGFLGCSSADKTASVYLEAGRAYQLRVDNVVTLPVVEAFDNTLFPRISGLRVGLALEQNEPEMLAQAVAAARQADVAVVVVGHNKDSEGEGGDRATMQLPGRTDELVAAVCAANPNTVVVVQSASAVAMPWVDAASGLVMAWYQGQENGHALAAALLGDCDFSGRLPITFPRRLEDHGSNAWFPGEAAQDRNTFGEGVRVGYRHFDAQGIPALWPFGFGLSYTQFQLTNIRVCGRVEGRSPESQPVLIQARVCNVGGRDGQEVVQVYVAPSAGIREAGEMSFPKSLAGFCKISVPAGDSREVSIPIWGSELSWYDAQVTQWRLDAGKYACWVGRSSSHIDAELEIEHPSHCILSSSMDLTAPVACLGCREKHLKCDGNLAGCARCQSLGLTCRFVPSRRGRLQLISLYYLHFHQAHPFLAPMQLLLESEPPAFLLDIIEFISLHYLSPQLFQDSSESLGLAVQAAELTIEKVQALLLLTIVHHGRQQAHEARSCLGQALQGALDLGLHRRETSDAIRVDAPFQAESLRRTWWEIVVIDVLLAAVQVDGVLQFHMEETPTTPLPGDPSQYQASDVISDPNPFPSTLADLEQNGLFCGDVEFSPGAYRVEAALLLRNCLRAGQTHVSEEALNILNAANVAWFHRLPPRRRCMLQLNGVQDELMTQAMMLMHCATIYLHFPRSCLLAFLPVTGQVMCSSPALFVTTTLDPQVHTHRVIEGSVRLSQLAALSTSVVNHTPFFACTLVLSSVIQVAAMFSESLHSSGTSQRQYLALNLGVLKSMGQTWPIAAAATQRVRQAMIEVHNAIPRDVNALLEEVSPPA
ncbi:putative beta-glucosidase precursor [Aspergillus welwitschiae]|uniref:beta-glucosidase n=1 Tax=Aspergillus welwitschiae TaxID=1341132 RepID=A0A3F3PVD4_9EURO|nr:putative beta-glucosidase precursor [Aspergillus welwitschiae]RDH30891.1 putative beta-glucosidase precursor [Aspergillus welwitschiae]